MLIFEVLYNLIVNHVILLNRAKSVWMMEGLLVYLTEEQVQNLLHFISELTVPGSYVIVSDIIFTLGPFNL